MKRSDETGVTARTTYNRVLQALAGQPRLSVDEVRERLELSPETFAAVWEGRSVLHGDARERLVHLLREEIAWHKDLLFRLERERAEDGARTRIRKDRVETER